MDLVIAALATWQIVEIWHHSSIMASLRSRTEMWDNKLGELLGCPFCLSPWIALGCVLAITLAEEGLAGGVAIVVVNAFAVARLANLGNDFFKQYCNTPRVSFDYGDESSGSDITDNAEEAGTV